MAQIKSIGLEPYAQCTMCGITGSYQFHHIIPKRLGIKTDIVITTLYALLPGEKQTKHTLRIKPEELCIKVCQKCHVQLHKENRA